LPGDIRDKLMRLDLSKDEKKEIKKELAFLTKDKQNDYMKELYRKKNKFA